MFDRVLDRVNLTDQVFVRVFVWVEAYQSNLVRVNFTDQASSGDYLIGNLFVWVIKFVRVFPQ